jgi:hypothetical protein
MRRLYTVVLKMYILYGFELDHNFQQAICIVKRRRLSKRLSCGSPVNDVIHLSQPVTGRYIKNFNFTYSIYRDGKEPLLNVLGFLIIPRNGFQF